MKVLLVHNRYRHPGGEDEVFLRENHLLRSAGHDVVEYTRDNREIIEDGTWNKAQLALHTLWASDAKEELRTILRKERPSLAHFHNTFPLISPAAYSACEDEGVPVVQSLHNFRLFCPAATSYREGKVCEECFGKAVPWPSMVHSCYRSSFFSTAAVAGMLMLHRFTGTWQQKVDAYIVFTDFFRQKFSAAGLPAEKIHVKPHFLHADPGIKKGTGDYALFVGRLVPEKGVLTLLKAWETLPHVPLLIGGEGPLEQVVRRISLTGPSIRMVPRMAREQCFELIKRARFLVWPSEGYVETFGLVAIEAFACATPVIASGLPSMAEIVKNEKTGLHFEPGNPKDLAEKVAWAWANPKQLKTMGEAARAEYEAKYTAERNYPLLMRIYERACRTSAQNSSAEGQVLQ